MVSWSKTYHPASTSEPTPQGTARPEPQRVAPQPVPPEPDWLAQVFLVWVTLCGMFCTTAYVAGLAVRLFRLGAGW